MDVADTSLEEEARTTSRRIISQFRSLLHSLSGNEKESAVVQFILDHPTRLAAISISDFADEVRVSESTIVKVCKKVGLGGFRDLKRAFLNFTPSRADAIGEEIDPLDDYETIANKLFAIAVQDIHDTRAILDLEQLERAVHAVRAARKVACYGVGGSGPLALDANHKFLLTGFESESYTDSHLVAMSASMLHADDVALVFSYSGETRPILGAVKLANERGATTICITSHRNTSLTQLASISLFAAAREQPITGENSTVRLVQKLVLDCLFACVVKDTREKVEEAFHRTTSAIKEV